MSITAASLVALNAAVAALEALMDTCTGSLAAGEELVFTPDLTVGDGPESGINARRIVLDPITGGNKYFGIGNNAQKLNNMYAVLGLGVWSSTDET